MLLPPCTHYPYPKHIILTEGNIPSNSELLGQGRKSENLPSSCNFYICFSFPVGTCGKESTRQCRRSKRWGFDLCVGKIPWRRAWQLTSEFLPGESHGQRSLAAQDWNNLARSNCFKTLVCFSLFHSESHSPFPLLFYLFLSKKLEKMLLDDFFSETLTLVVYWLVNYLCSMSMFLCLQVEGS